MSSLKEKIAAAISNHVSLEDTYTYELTRTKSAFEVGTMSLEDFEEWTEENVDDLAKAIVGVLQPQLNENQKNKTNNNLLKINDLAFDLQHDDELTAEQFLKVKQIFELSLQYQLDENQQIVLDWLKAYSERSTFSAMYPIFQLGDYDRRVLEGPRQIDRAFSELNFRQESQVLQAYSQWALEQEEEK